ncbi:Stretch-activated Ca-permeable channel [Coniochaeta hoffmannii]|uniref:Stretch-activated Ca-permeable channel n=1 Tax=Coniochaeta hoffmannii TaxID=91930 RepID=A0AA38VN43_9PEZI|nr:Stretch-activated Ca-permeable channel [Coniochaeta hoffmannii]
MKLSPLQSRLAASLLGSVLLLFIYFSLFSPQFALADERLEQTLPILLDDIDIPLALEDETARDPEYQPDFAAFDRSIIGRAPAGVTGLANNVPMPMNVEAGTTQLFAFEKGSIFENEERTLELRGEDGGGSHAVIPRADEERSTGEEEVEDRRIEKRQSSKMIFISANTCTQPNPDPDKTSMDPPQLTMFVSTNPKNQSPGPSADANTQVVVEFVEGAVMYNTTTTGDVFIGIHAPNVSSSLFMGQTYNFEVAASSEAYFHSYNAQQDADLIWVDSDSQGALLITHNLTDSTDEATADQIMRTQPYVMFAQNTQEEWSIKGLKYSYCGLQNNAQIAATRNGKFASMVTTGMTRRGPGNLPKQEFYFSGLNASASYLGILALNGDEGKSGSGVVGGGGHVYRATNFTTKSDHGNCQIILNLPFCDQVAYSVPSNPNSFANATLLATFYDNLAQSAYSNFQKALAQISCEAPATQRYSLVRTCDDCAAAYKSWLCSVTIPRCEDFSTTDAWLQPRNLRQAFPNGETLDAATLAGFGNTSAVTSSRNPAIDEVVRPGPYKEVLPCEDLCYNLTQSCPSALGFNCPRPGMVGFNTSYGIRGKQDENGEVYCNYPGAAHVFSGAGRIGDGAVGLALGVVGLLGVLLGLF